MNLRDFPFDVQELPVNISSDWLASDMSFVFVNDPVVKDSGEYTLTGVNVETLEHHYANLARYDFQHEGYHEISVKFQFARNPIYYLRGLFLIINLVLLISSFTFWIDPSDVGTRASLSSTMFLTLVAFHFVILDSLPKVAYSTRLDKWIVGCYALMFYSNASDILLYRLATKDTEICDQVCAPLDYAFFAIFLLVQLCNGVWFIFPYFKRKKGFEKLSSLKKKE